jgi:hypothetical protein
MCNQSAHASPDRKYTKKRTGVHTEMKTDNNWQKEKHNNAKKSNNNNATKRKHINAKMSKCNIAKKRKYDRCKETTYFTCRIVALYLSYFRFFASKIQKVKKRRDDKVNFVVHLCFRIFA